MTTYPHAASSTEEVLEFLNEDLRTTLALLHPVDDELAALTLAALPLGSRSTLARLGAIVLLEVDVPDAPVTVTLTTRGRELITACSLADLPESVEQDLAALEEARARRNAERPETARPRRRDVNA